MMRSVNKFQKSFKKHLISVFWWHGYQRILMRCFLKFKFMYNLPPLLPSSIDSSNLPLLIDQRVALNYELVVSNTLQGVGDLYNIYDSSGLKNGQHLIPNLRSRKHIDDLTLGGYLHYWQRNWWLGFSYSTSLITGIPLGQSQAPSDFIILL